jgi:hypothetical protein
MRISMSLLFSGEILGLSMAKAYDVLNDSESI